MDQDHNLQPTGCGPSLIMELCFWAGVCPSSCLCAFYIFCVCVCVLYTCISASHLPNPIIISLIISGLLFFSVGPCPVCCALCNT